MFYILKKNNFKFEEYLFFVTFAIISGPLIAEFVINIISIKFLILAIKKKIIHIFNMKLLKF